jgi:hypothetical protein
MLAAGLVLVAGAGAGTRPAAAPEALDLSSLTKIKSYLRSIGVNPKSVVIQRAKKNYAGPNCPGKGWNCTKGTRTLQIGAVNSYECTGGSGTNSGGTQTCTGTGVQVGDKNTFRCIEKTSVDPAVQQCSATQGGPSNYALVQQVADLGGSDPDQDATQTANITQSGSGKNEVHIHQTIRESTTATGATTQDGHQVAIVDQDATGSAKNFSDVHQYMDLRASGGASQMQNTEGLPVGVVDCAGAGDILSPSAPNQCANINQSAETAGSNLQHLHQLIDEDAKTSSGNQNQGTPNGGIDSEVHQSISSGSFRFMAAGLGSSESHANQARRQNVSGPGTQIQIDPTRCCGVSQEGGQNNHEDINQGGSQNSNRNEAEQELMLIGECNTENGSCLITHHARNDEDHAQYNCGKVGDPCPEPAAVTNCTSTEAADYYETPGCTTPDDTICVECFLIFTQSSLLPGTLLSGFEVTMGLVAPDLTYFTP